VSQQTTPASVSAPPGPPPGLSELNVTPPVTTYVGELWRRREFALAVAQGELRAKHLDTLLGNLWHLLNPLLLIGVYYVVFGVLLDTSRGVTNFISFLAIGVLSYHFIQRSVMSGAATIVNNEGLIRSLQFPRALLPISAMLRETIAFGSAMVVMVAVVLITREPISLMWLFVVPAILLQLVFSTGVALFFARLGDKVRDILNVIPYIFRMFFYLSGVLFSADYFIPRIGEPFDALPLHELFVMNPFYVFISLPREYLIASEEHAFVPEMWLSAGVWAVVALLVGLLVFRAGEREYGRG
jgi:teichoic acid transport system permease protein